MEGLNQFKELHGEKGYLDLILTGVLMHRQCPEYNLGTTFLENCINYCIEQGHVVLDVPVIVVSGMRQGDEHVDHAVKIANETMKRNDIILTDKDGKPKDAYLEKVFNSESKLSGIVDEVFEQQYGTNL